MSHKNKLGLNKPSIDELLKHIDSKYKLVYLSSKIAHVIEDQRLDLSHIPGKKIVSKALNEIVQGNFKIVFK